MKTPPWCVVKVRNRTTGVAVSLLEKCVVENRLSVIRDRRQGSYRPSGQAVGVNSAETKLDGPLVGRLTFIEDFTREHSLSVVKIASIEIAGAF
jgi:hypothetical protein